MLDTGSVNRKARAKKTEMDPGLQGRTMAPKKAP
jgi:hypothetical protein